MDIDLDSGDWEPGLRSLGDFVINVVVAIVASAGTSELSSIAAGNGGEFGDLERVLDLDR